MSAVPPSNGKSTPFFFTLTVWATPRSRRMSPPATSVQSFDASNGWLAGCRVDGSCAVSGQSAVCFT